MSKHDRFSRGAKQLARSADIPLSVAKRLLEQGISEHRKINDGTARPVAAGKATAEVIEFPPQGSREHSELIELARNGVFRLAQAADGDWFDWNINHDPHALVAAKTGWGKSVAVAIFEHYAVNCPDAFEFFTCDHFGLGPSDKRKNAPNLRGVIISQEEAVAAIAEVHGERMRRMELFKDAGCRNIAELQERQRREEGDPMKRLLLLGDELLMRLRPTSGSSDAATLRGAHAQLKDIALTGRAMGIHLLLTNNALYGTEISSELLAQLGCRIAIGPIDQYVATKLFDDPTKTNDTHRKGALLAYSHTAGYQRAQLMYLDAFN